MLFVEDSCRNFVSALAGKEPVPGGGGACALAGAVGIALGNMVGALTAGKKKYQPVEAEVLLLMKKATTLQTELLDLVQRDAEGFVPLAKAYGMPKETAQEQTERAAVMEQALKTACVVPLSIMQHCCEAIELHKSFAEKGNALVISDAGAGAALCRGALAGAALNVFVNTAAMTDRVYAKVLNQRANAMLEAHLALADEVYHYVLQRLT